QILALIAPHLHIETKRSMVHAPIQPRWLEATDLVKRHPDPHDYPVWIRLITTDVAPDNACLPLCRAERGKLRMVAFCICMCCVIGWNEHLILIRVEVHQIR